MGSIKGAFIYIKTFFKWIIIASVTGALGGFIGTFFHIAVEFATEIRTENPLVILALPLSGILIVFLYRITKQSESKGTNEVINSIRTKDKVPFLMAPLIFISTVITHFFGGSAGREGAALQLGGSIGSQVGRLFRLDEKDMHLVTMCGMSGVFSALFGTPLTATFFAMEVISVGVVYYSSIVPCITSSLVAFGVSLFFGVSPVKYVIETSPSLELIPILQTVALSVLCAVVSIIFCLSMHKTAKFLNEKIPNEYIRIVVGGAAIVALTFILQTNDYNGAGMNIIQNAIDGNANWEAFLLKIVFTAITIGAGFKGGEIVPTFFIGATFGCVIGTLFGMNPAFGAAIGLVATFCGVINCPIASIILSVELFGADNIIFFAIACGVSYMFSGYYGLYSSQKIVYSKLRAEYININAK